MGAELLPWLPTIPDFYPEQNAIYRKSLAAFFVLGGTFEIDLLHKKKTVQTFLESVQNKISNK